MRKEKVVLDLGGADAGIFTLQGGQVQYKFLAVAVLFQPLGALRSRVSTRPMPHLV